MLMAFVGREQSVPSPRSRTCDSTVKSSFIFSNSGTAKVALCLVCRQIGNIGTGPDAKINFGDYAVYQPIRDMIYS